VRIEAIWACVVLHGNDDRINSSSSGMLKTIVAAFIVVIGSFRLQMMMDLFVVRRILVVERYLCIVLIVLIMTLQ